MTNNISDKKTLNGFKERIERANKFGDHIKEIINECIKNINNVDPDDTEKVREFVFAFYMLETMIDYLSEGFEKALLTKIEKLQGKVKDLQEKININ